MSSPTDAPARQFGTPTEFENELASQVALLEAMFNDPGLLRLRRRRPNHPAVRRHDGLMEGRQVRFDEDAERRRVQDLAQGFVDRQTWAQNPGVRPFWGTTVPDPEQARQIERRIEDPAHYDDMTLELFVWGGLRYAGLAAELQERDGEPDIRLGSPPDARWVEVKRIHLGTLPTRVPKVLAKANRQIKSVSPGDAGTAYLFIDTAGDVAVFDDTVPAEIDQYVAEVRRVLAGTHDGHVGQVVVGWDDFMVMGHRPDPVLYAVRRRALVLDHGSPVSPHPDTNWVAIFGFTSTMWISSHAPSVAPPPAIATGSLVISQLFQQRNNWAGGIRATHARRVLVSPDGQRVIPLADSGMSVVLVAKRIDLTDPPHLVLLIGYQRDGEPLTLSDGFRLQAPEAELEAWRRDPSRAFDELLRRFALPVSIGPGPAQVFHLHWAGRDPPVLSGGTSRGPVAIAAVIKYSPPLWQVHWVYAIDDAAYRASYGR